MSQEDTKGHVLRHKETWLLVSQGNRLLLLGEDMFIVSVCDPRRHALLCQKKIFHPMTQEDMCLVTQENMLYGARGTFSLAHKEAFPFVTQEDQLRSTVSFSNTNTKCFVR